MNKEKLIKLLETLDKEKIKYKTGKLTKTKFDKEMNRKINWFELNPDIFIEILKTKKQ